VRSHLVLTPPCGVSATAARQGPAPLEKPQGRSAGPALPRLSSLLLAAYRKSILFLFGWRMKPEGLSQLVSELSPAEQSAVKEFITFLKERNGKLPKTSFQAAIDEFIAAHPELLRRLAQ